MHTLATTLAAFAALAAIPSVSAHGWISGVSVNGKAYPAVNPSWHITGKTPSVVWYSENFGQQDPLFSKDVGTNNAACHINATPGSLVVPVKPGDTLELKWQTPEGVTAPWRSSHEGPMIDYMASCGSDCRHASAANLKFFKIAEQGMFKSPHTPGGDGVFGLWGTDTLRNANNVWKVTIPQGLSGPHVLRTEAFALMGAGNLGHAQMYPQCINLEIAGPAHGVDPCTSGADCRLGRELYKTTDPGLFISIHKAIAKYLIPGPALWRGAAKNPNAIPQGASVPSSDQKAQNRFSNAGKHGDAKTPSPYGQTHGDSGPHDPLHTSPDSYSSTKQKHGGATAGGRKEQGAQRKQGGKKAAHHPHHRPAESY